MINDRSQTRFGAGAMPGPAPASPVPSPGRRALLGGGLATGFLASVGLPAFRPASASAAMPQDQIVVQADEQGDTTFTDWGYDVKQGTRAEQLTTERARELFVDLGMTVLRIPIYGTAHPAPGEVITSQYDSVIQAVRRTRAVRPDVTIFASLKLAQQQTFPDWVRNDDRTVRWQEYSLLLVDFLRYVGSQGINIDVLGPDNEPEFNRGELGPNDHRRIVAVIKDEAPRLGLAVPKIIGPETYGPQNAWPWLDDLHAGGWFDSIDYAGTHYYSFRRKSPAYAARVARVAESARNKPAWQTEFHWDPSDKMLDENGNPYEPGNVYIGALYGLISAFDHLDVGFRGITWWNFHRPSLDPLEIELQTALVTSTGSSRTVRTEDGDGVRLDLGKLNTRTFRQDDQLNLWVINDGAASHAAKPVFVRGARCAPTARWTQWSNAAGRIEGTTQVTGGARLSLALPTKSITLIRIPFGDGFADLNGSKELDHHG